MLNEVRYVTAQSPSIFRSLNNSKGLAPVIIVAIVAVLLAAGGGLYFLTQKNGGGSPLSSITSGNPLSKVALNPNCKYNDPELCKFMNNWMVTKDYSVSSVTSMGGMNTESTYSISGDDKFQMISKLNGKENSNMISIGDTTYTLDYTDSKWWKQTFKKEDTQSSEVSEITEQFDFNAEEVEDKTEYKFIAKEACGNKNCFKYEIISPDMDLGKQFIWFDDSEYLMRKMRIESKEGTSESTFTYDNVSINVPSPVKEGAPGAQMGAPSDAEVQQMMKEYEKQMQKEDQQQNPDPVKAAPSFDMEQPLDEGISEEDYF